MTNQLMWLSGWENGKLSIFAPPNRLSNQVSERERERSYALGKWYIYKAIEHRDNEGLMGTSNYEFIIRSVDIYTVQSHANRVNMSHYWVHCTARANARTTGNWLSSWMCNQQRWINIERRKYKPHYLNVYWQVRSVQLTKSKGLTMWSNMASTTNWN